MYFWRIGALKARLLQEPLSDREALPYLVVWSALIAAAGLLPAYPMNAWDFVGSGWSVVVTVVGTIYVYRRNGGRSGRHLLQRYLAIGWVVGVRWFAAMLVVLAVYFGAVDAFGEISEDTSWKECLMFATAESVLYWRMGHHVSQVAHADARPEGSPEPSREG